MRLAAKVAICALRFENGAIFLRLRLLGVLLTVVRTCGLHAFHLMA